MHHGEPVQVGVDTLHVVLCLHPPVREQLLWRNADTRHGPIVGAEGEDILLYLVCMNMITQSAVLAVALGREGCAVAARGWP
jgi:hypothetical protein